MRATHEGVELTKPELVAAIAAANPSSSKLNVVAFEAALNTIRMYASDGRVAIQATGVNAGLHGGRWCVSLAFLDMVKKSMASKAICRLCFSGASLHQAIVLEMFDDDDGDPVLDETGSIVWPADAADHVKRFPFDELATSFRDSPLIHGVPAPVTPRYYELLALVGKCGISAFERCPGRDRHHAPMIDTATSSNGTDWCCLSVPYREVGKNDGSSKDMHDRQLDFWSMRPATRVTSDGEVVEVGSKEEAEAQEVEAQAETEEALEEAPKRRSKPPKRRKGVRSPEEVEQEASQ